MCTSINHEMLQPWCNLTGLCNFDDFVFSPKGGNYVLPMSWQGNPVSLWCPKPATPGPTTVPQTPGSPVVVPETTTATATTTMKPDVPTFLQYHSFFPLYPYYFPPLPVTTPAPTTTTAPPATTATTTVAAPALMYPLPLYPSLYAPFPWGLPGPLPAAAEPTITETNMTEPQLLPCPQILPWYLQYLPYRNFFPQFIPPYPQYLINIPETTQTTTTMTTTIEKTDPVQHHQHFHPVFRPYFKYLIVPDHPPSH